MEDNNLELNNSFVNYFHSFPEGVVILDDMLKIVHTNPAFAHLFHYSLADVTKQNILQLNSNKPPTLPTDLLKYLKDNQGWQGLAWLKLKTGELKLFQTSIAEVDNSQPQQYICTFTDLSKSINTFETIPNQQLFIEHLRAVIKKNEEKRQGFALVLLNVDNFSLVNESLGVQKGDELLYQLFERIKSFNKNEQSFVGNLGGDNFALVMNHADDFESKDVSNKVSELLNAISDETFVIGKHRIPLSASFGISIYPSQGELAEVQFNKAMVALNESKRLGKRTITFYANHLSGDVDRKAMLTEYLHVALSNNELSLYYQPKIDLKTTKVVGSEALLRWKHPSLGFIPPNEFIPIAEESGLIRDIGDWTIKTASEDTVKIREDIGEDLSVSVNLSAQQLNSGDIAANIANILFSTGLDPNHLEIELTEGDVLENIDQSMLKLHVLQTMGIKLVVDDFGTGYSSMSQLVKFPIHALKIDKFFIHGLPSDQGRASIVFSIIRLAKDLGLLTVAEGVESPGELEYLTQAECDYAQGYCFSKPIPYSDYVKFVKSRN